MAGKTGAGALHPDEVFKVVDHALTASKPKARYVVGTEAKVQALMRTLLSKRAFDRVVARRMGL